MATYSAPCTVRVTSATPPAMTVYQSRMPGCGLSLKLVHRGSKKQPNFVTVPHGSDRPQHRAALLASFGHDEIDHARTKVEAIEHHVSSQHECNDDEPKCFHKTPSEQPAVPRLARARSRGASGTETGCPAPCTSP